MYTPVFARILHEISYPFPSAFPLSFNAQTWLDSAVLLASLLFRLCLWPLYLSLNVKPVDQIYFYKEVSVCTSAWYTTGPSWHSPLNGQIFFSRQLHFFFSLSEPLAFMTILLCLLICFAMFRVVE